MTGFQVSDSLQATYGHYYDDGESEWRWIGALGKAANVVRLCQRYAHDDVLEVGAGEGSVLQRLSDTGFGERLFALEISESAIAAIRQRGITHLAECGLFDGYTIPYPDGRFDLAILSHVVEHLEYPRRLLHEARRVARYVFVEVPLEDTLRLRRDYKADSVGHINFYSPRTIRRLLQTCGFEVLLQEVVNSPLAAYRYRSRRTGFMRYLVKQSLLRTVPSLAPRIVTFHCALVCKS